MQCCAGTQRSRILCSHKQSTFTETRIDVTACRLGPCKLCYSSCLVNKIYDGTTAQWHCALYTYMPAPHQADLDAFWLVIKDIRSPQASATHAPRHLFVFLKQSTAWGTQPAIHEATVPDRRCTAQCADRLWEHMEDTVGPGDAQRHSEKAIGRRVTALRSTHMTGSSGGS